MGRYLSICQRDDRVCIERILVSLANILDQIEVRIRREQYEARKELKRARYLLDPKHAKDQHSGFPGTGSAQDKYT